MKDDVLVSLCNVAASDDVITAAIAAIGDPMLAYATAEVDRDEQYGTSLFVRFGFMGTDSRGIDALKRAGFWDDNGLWDSGGCYCLDTYVDMNGVSR